MDEFLEHLTDEDRKLLTERATRARYEVDQTILSEGEHHQAIFILRKGSARVERGYEGFNIQISRLAAGEVFGEMSFLEDIAASAGVVATEAVEVDIIEHAVVEELTAGHPGFAGRFYRSLATLLSRRLRETTLRSLEGYSWGGDVAAWESRPADEVEEEQAGWGGGNPFQEV